MLPGNLPVGEPRTGRRIQDIIATRKEIAIMIGARLLKWILKIYYWRSRLQIRIYRVITAEDIFFSRSIIIEDATHNRFVENVYFSSSMGFAKAIIELIDLNDAWNAINCFKYSPMIVNRKWWNEAGAHTLDMAVMRAEANRERLLENFTGAVETRAEINETDAGGEANTIDAEGSIEQASYDRMVSETFKRVCRIASAKNVYWKPVHSVSGYRCQILVIDESEEHQVP